MPAYVLPNFNILVAIYGFEAAPPGWPRVPTVSPRHEDVDAQLTYGRRVNVASSGGTFDPGVPVMCMNLLLEPGTDIRGLQDSIGQDVVEVPEGTGRWYQVLWVDDIGKGFANEHRTALLLALEGTWVAPYG